MKQPKKIFTRMLINNWGGISHKMLEFHEVCEIFSAERADRGKIDGYGCDTGCSVWECVC